MIATRSARYCTLLAALLVGACTAAPRAADSKTAALREHDPALDESDPCVKNLDRIVEALLLYYSAYHRLPDSLADARPLSAVDAAAPFALLCPRSGKPYLYHPQPLAAPESLIPTHMRLLLHDPEAVHPIRQTLSDGKDQYDYLRTVRYGIVMRPLTPGEPLQVFVVPLDDNLLKLYTSQTPGTPAHP